MISTSIVSRGGLLAAAGTAVLLMTVGMNAHGAEPGSSERAAVIEEVVVTARRTEESLQDVPIAITAFSESDLDRKSIKTPIDLMFHSPSLTMTTAYGGLNGSFTVRGLSLGTTTYFAEVPAGPTNPAAPLFDIESVQVLNGPQGTQFGRANTAGAVLITPNGPDLSAREGSFRVTAGNYGRNELTGVLNVPLIEGELALRIAGNRTRRDGYMKLLETGEEVSDTDMDSLRVSLEWSPGDGRFTNSSIFNLWRVDQKPSVYTLAAYNPDFSLYNLPASIDAPGGAAVGGAVFGGVCASAVGFGLSPSTNDCIDERLRILAAFKPDLEAEMARLSGGDSAKRRTPAPDFVQKEELEQYTFINTTEYNFGEVGPTTLGVKNIFGYEQSTGTTGWMVDGFGGRIQGAIALNNLANYNYSSSANQVGNQPVYEKGPSTKQYTNELQFQGDINNGLVNWILGGYYQRVELPSNTDGVRNMYQVFEGVLTPNLGWQPAFPFQDGGYTEQEAAFVQATFDLSSWFPAVAGVHLTGGFRRSWDEEKLDTVGVSVSYPSGEMVPGNPATSRSKSDGDNTSISLDVQVTDDLLVYLARREGYRPGGQNQVIASIGLPNYSPAYGPETVEDWELGLKYAFATDAVQGRLNIAAYRADYTDIQRTLRAFVNGASAVYQANVAEARLEGIEVQGSFVSGPWQLDLTYSYGDAGYEEWVGSDPFNLIRPGDPMCLPESTAEACLLDLSGNAIPNTPKHQASATVSYDIPINEQYGQLMASFTVSHRSRAYLVGESERNIQIFGDDILDAISVPSYERYDARLDWSNVFGSNFDAGLFVYNATDELYAVSAVTQMTTLGMGVKMYAPPRTWGAELTYRFGQ